MCQNLPKGRFRVVIEYKLNAYGSFMGFEEAVVIPVSEDFRPTLDA